MKYAVKKVKRQATDWEKNVLAKKSNPESIDDIKSKLSSIIEESDEFDDSIEGLTPPPDFENGGRRYRPIRCGKCRCRRRR